MIEKLLLAWTFDSKTILYLMSTVVVLIKHYCCSVTQSCPTLWDLMGCQTSPSFIISEFAQTHVHWVSDAIQLSHLPLLLLPSIFPSTMAFSNESALCIRWPKHWSFSFSINPSNEYSGLISLRIDWLDLLEVQGTFKSLLWQHGSKPSILHCSAFFMVQLSHPYMTIGKKKTHSFD